MKYLAIIVTTALFVMMLVWQNVEVMKMKLDYRELSGKRKALINQNDMLRYRIEGFKTVPIVTERARAQGMGAIEPGDVDVVIVKKKQVKQ